MRIASLARNTLLLSTLLLLTAFSSAVGQTGKLSGTVFDEQGQPVIGATVLLVGTSIGTAVDVDGQYAVINIPVGGYSVRYSSIGYQTKVVEGVRITSNNTTVQNVILAEEVFEGQELIVVAERPIVDVSQTSAVATLSREEIDVLPVQQLDDIINLQAGVIEDGSGGLHFRGGRTGEVQFQVDGVSVNNPYNNESSVELDRSVLQEVQVISGTFDAEYGQAMSGVVNAVLRSGDADRYEFSAEMFMGDFFSPGNDSLVNAVGQKTAFFPRIDDLSPTTLQNYQLSFSGPVPVVRNTTFLGNVQRYVNDGYLTGERLFVPTDSSDFQLNEFFPTGDREIVSLSYDHRYNWLAKLSNRSIPKVKLEYQLLGNSFERKGYNHAYRFNPDGTRTQREFSIVHGFDWTHTLSDKMYYNASVRQNYFDYSDYRYEAVDDPRYFEAGQPQGSASFEDGAVVQGVDLGRFIQTTNAYVFKGSLERQSTKVHLVKAGLEAQVYDLDFGAPGIIVNSIVDGEQQLVVRTDTIGARVINFKPRSAAAFVQDRVEWRDLRIRAGIRFEAFEANATVPSELGNPANSIQGAPPSFAKSTTLKLVAAPRLGLSFPILDRASMFFSYGHFYQMPQLGIMFSNADYSILENLQFGAEAEKGILGNPDLRPEFTVQYEFGFKSALTRDLGLDVSLFYKDIRDLLGVEFIQTFTAASYARYTNVDFGEVGGFTLSFDQRTDSGIRTTLDYTFQRAIGNSSDPRETFNRQAAGEDPRPRQVAFNWDQRHALNATIGWFKRDNFSLTAVLKAGTGQPFTPSISSVFGSDLEPNSGRKDGFFLVDVRAEKYFKVGATNLTVFTRVFNLLDEHFVNGFVFSSTGSPFYTLTPEAQRAQLNNPSRFFQPRRIEIGVSFRGAFDR
jgi:outer membrane receptor protein involved in Fe transport